MSQAESGQVIQQAHGRARLEDRSRCGQVGFDGRLIEGDPKESRYEARQACARLVPGPGHEVGGGRAVLIHQVRIGAAFEQDADRVGAPEEGRRVQRRRPLSVPGADLRPALEEQLTGVGVPPGCRPVQGREVQLVGGVRVGPRIEELRQSLEVPPLRGARQVRCAEGGFPPGP